MLALLVACGCTRPLALPVPFVAALLLFLAHWPDFLGIPWRPGFVLQHWDSCCARGDSHNSGRRGCASCWPISHCYMQRRLLEAGLPSCSVGGCSTCAGTAPTFGLCALSGYLSGGKRPLIGFFNI